MVVWDVFHQQNHIDSPMVARPLCFGVYRNIHIFFDGKDPSLDGTNKPSNQVWGHAVEWHFVPHLVNGLVNGVFVHKSNVDFG